MAESKGLQIENGKLIGPGTCKDKDIVVPDGVKVIGGFAFGKSKLRSVVIPDSVERIEDAAFASCYSLTSITLGKGVTSIGAEAFRACHMETIEIPASVKALGNLAFVNCKCLRKIRFEEGLEQIGTCAFSNCTLLDNVILPASLKKIGHRAFESCYGLRTIQIQDGTNFIGYNAFAFCRSLSSVVIPPSVSDIGDFAFYCCYSLKNVALLCEKMKEKKLSNNMFEHCINLESIAIPDCFEKIGFGAFLKCRALKTVVLPSTLKEIAPQAFAECIALEEVNLPDDANISSSAFDGCFKAPVKCVQYVLRIEEKIKFLWAHVEAAGEGAVDTEVIKYAKKYKRQAIAYAIENNKPQILAFFLNLPGRMQITTIDSFIYNAEGKAEVMALLLAHKRKLFSQDYIDTKEQDKEDKAFGVKELTLADWRQIFVVSKVKGGWKLSGYKQREAHVIIPSEICGEPVVELFHTFKGHKEVISVTIPSTVEVIGESAFQESGINSIIMPYGVKTIGIDAFRLCESLESVVISDSVEKVSGCAFNACRNLKSAIVGDRVKEIGIGAFMGCGNIQTVVLPTSLKAVGQMVFNWCSSLKNLKYKGTISEWKTVKKIGRGSIYASSGGLVVHCTDGDTNY